MHDNIQTNQTATAAFSSSLLLHGGCTFQQTSRTAADNDYNNKTSNSNITSKETMNYRVGAKYETIGVRFDGFEGLPARKGRDFVRSPKFTCFGHQWHLRVFPGGSRDSDDGKVSIYLMSRPGGNIISGGIRSIEFQSRFIVGSVIQAAQSRNGGSLGVSNFAKRSTLIRALDEGALVIEVLMKKHEPIVPPMPFTPENPFCKIMLKKCMDDTCSDAVFEVGDERVVIHAHRFILKDGAPTLFDLCASDSDSAAIPIMDVQPEIFRHLLRYVYGGSIPAEYLKDHAKDIIDAADKYEVVNLKLEAEAMLVFSTSITIDNVVELLLYSHGKNCALLKEALVDFIVENGDDILRKVRLSRETMIALLEES